MTKSVLLVSNVLPHYRLPLFERLAKKYSLTVAHGGKTLDGVSFTQKKIRVDHKFGLQFHRELPDFDDFDTVIIPFNLRMVTMYRRLLSGRANRLLLFGIGVSASYDSPYDRDKRLDFVRRWWIRHADSAVFYEQYPSIKYASQGVDPRKLFVAYNTVEPSGDFSFSERTFDRFVFIGSLYKQKKIFVLLKAYELVFERLGAKTPPLDLVGDGEERKKVESWIIDRGLEDRVVVHGEVSRVAELEPILKQSIACISPGQAGLSVQRCFSFGVPFITTSTAITGGELFSIIHGVNGFLYDGTTKSLEKLLLRLSADHVDIESISRNAREFYLRFRHPDIWVDGFVRAIESD